MKQVKPFVIRNLGSFDLADIQQLRAILYLVNHSLSQFIDCLGLWMSFYPQFWDEIARKLVCDPEFSLFEHEEMYRPIIEKLKEVDPQSMREKKFFGAECVSRTLYEY